MSTRKGRSVKVASAVGSVVENLEQRWMLSVAAPDGLKATGKTFGQIDLSWADHAVNDTNYEIERKADGGSWTYLNTIDGNGTATAALTYSDASLTAGTHYTYRVRAKDADHGNEYSSYSNEDEATTWAGADIGSSTGGSSSLSSDTFTVTGKGGGIGGNADDFRYTYKTLVGDGEIVARVPTIQNTNPLAKAGIMFRSGLTANAANAMIALTPSSGAQWQYRNNSGDGTQSNGFGGWGPGDWIRLVRRGAKFTAYVSHTGQASSWTQLATQTISSFANTSTPIYVGLALSASGYGAYNTSTFSSVWADKTPFPLPSGWTNQNLGSPSQGSARYYNDTWTFEVESTGQNVAGTSDAFHFAHRTLAGDGEIVAKINDMGTSPYTYAKAGVMFRDGMTDNAKNVFMAISGNNGAVFQRRDSSGGNTSESWSGNSNHHAPYWVKLKRVGNSFSGYVSSDGNTWTQVGSTSTVSMSSSVEVGIALSAAGYGAVNTTNYKHVTVLPAPLSLTATPIHAGEIDLAWSASAFSAEGFAIERRVTGGTFAKVGDVDYTAGTWKDTGVNSAQGYEYRICADLPGVTEANRTYSPVVSASTAGLGDGLAATYYNNKDFSGSTVSRVDAAINFDWGDETAGQGGTPDPAIQPSTFSAEWVGRIKPRYSDTYTFHVFSDDGVRLWVNDQLILDNWSVQSPVEIASQAISLQAGQLYNIRMDYFENGGGAYAHLYWSSGQQAKEVVPRGALFSTGNTSAAPAAPSGWSATPLLPGTISPANTTNYIELAVQAQPETVFEILRADSSDLQYVSIKDLGEGVSRWSDLVALDRNWAYQVRAVSAGGRSAWLDVLPAATGLVASSADSAVLLQFDPLSTGALVRRSTDNGPFVALPTGYIGAGATSFVDRTVQASHSYAYEVQAAAPLLRAAAVTTGQVTVTATRPPQGLHAVFYPTTMLSGQASPAQVVTTFDWSTNAPATSAGIGADGWSAVFTGNINVAQGGDWLFKTDADGGIRLWVDDQLVVDAWDKEKQLVAGDANADGTATFADFLILQNNYNQDGDWSKGDWNYDGLVTFADFLLLQNTYNQPRQRAQATSSHSYNLGQGAHRIKVHFRDQYAGADFKLYWKLAAASGFDQINAADLTPEGYDRAPTPSVAGAASATVGRPYTIALSYADSGPFGDATEWFVNWGDGTSQTVPAVTTSLTHTYSSGAGQARTVQATLLYGQGGAMLASPLNLSLAGNAVQVSGSGSGSVDEGIAYELSFSAAGVGTISKWTIDWGDGAQEDVPASASSATHTYANGSAVFTAKVAAVVGASSLWSAGHNVTVTNVAPQVTIKKTSSGGAAEGSAVSFAVDTLTDPAGVAETMRYAWSVRRGGSAVTLPPGTSVSGPTFKFVPPDDGTYEVKLTVNDGEASASATLNVDVAEVPPVLSVTGSQYAVKDASYTIGLSAQELGQDTFDHWTINWGDGTSTSTVSTASGSASHTYATTNQFTITATAHYDDGGSHAATLDVTVGDDNIFVPEIIVQDPDGGRTDGAQLVLRRTNTASEQVAYAELVWPGQLPWESSPLGTKNILDVFQAGQLISEDSEDLWWLPPQHSRFEVHFETGVEEVRLDVFWRNIPGADIGTAQRYIAAEFRISDLLHTQVAASSELRFAVDNAVDLRGCPGPTEPSLTDDSDVDNPSNPSWEDLWWLNAPNDDHFDDKPQQYYAPWASFQRRTWQGEVDGGYQVYWNNDDTDLNGTPDYVDIAHNYSGQYGRMTDYDFSLLRLAVTFGSEYGGGDYFLPDVLSFVRTPEEDWYDAWLEPGVLTIRQTSGFGKVRLFYGDLAPEKDDEFHGHPAVVIGDGVYERSWDFGHESPDLEAFEDAWGFLMLEGLEPSDHPGDVRFEVTYTGKQFATSIPGFTDEFTVTVLGRSVDIDIDADNDGGAERTIEHSTEEEKAEHAHDSPGAYLFVNDGDPDGDGVLGFADGYNLDGISGNADDSDYSALVPVDITIPSLGNESGQDPQLQSLIFTYDSSSPGAVVVSPAGTAADRAYATLPSGRLRLWTTNTDRQKNPVVGFPAGQAAGDYIPSGVPIPIAALGLDPSTAGPQTLHLYVEAVRPSDVVGDLSIGVEAVLASGLTPPPNTTLKDSIRVTARRLVAPTLGDGSAPGYQLPHADGMDTMALSYAGIVGLRDGSVNLVSHDLQSLSSSVPIGYTRVWSNQSGLRTVGDLGAYTHIAEDLDDFGPQDIQFRGLNASFGTPGWGSVIPVTDGIVPELTYFEEGDPLLMGSEHVGLLKSATLGAAGGNLTAYYTYVLDDTDPNNWVGLRVPETVTVVDGAGNIVGGWYYGYEKRQASDATDQLRREDWLPNVIVDPAGVADMVKAGSWPLDQLGMSNRFLTIWHYDKFAKYIIDYDSNDRVENLWVRGAGNLTAPNTTSSTWGKYTFAYETSDNVGPNVWTYKTTITDPSNLISVVYMNYRGRILLDESTDGAAGHRWSHVYRYDQYGRLEMEALPSAVTAAADENAMDLLGWDGDDFAGVSNDSGVVYKYQYCADEDGVPSGLLESSWLWHGDGGAKKIKLNEYDYLDDGSGHRLPYVVKERVWRDEAGLDVIETSYAITLRNIPESTPIPSKIQTTLPTVIDANGVSRTYTTTAEYDSMWRLTSSTDADGYVHQNIRNPATGLVTKTITDANGLALTSEVAQRDVRGRPLRTVDANGNSTSYFYIDGLADSEVWIRRPDGVWDVTISKPRTTQRQGYTEQRIISGAVTVVDNKPSGGTIESVTRTWYDAAGRVQYIDRYHNVPASFGDDHLGQVNTNYYRTEYRYDAAGRQYWEKDATGTIRKTEYDVLGRPIRYYIGTLENSLTLYKENVYDGGGSGDSNLTQVTLFPGALDPNRVTRYTYDWRNRLVATESGVVGTTAHPTEFLTYNNLGQVTQRDIYEAEAVNVTGGVPQAPAANGPRAREQYTLDKLGRVTKTTVFSITPVYPSLASEPSSWHLDIVTGGQPKTQVTRIFYDGRGNITAIEAPGGMTTLKHIDGAGRVDEVKVGDGAVWLQTAKTTYDKNSNVVLTAVTQQGPAGPRTTYTGYQYDSLNRATASVDFGTNSDAPPAVTQAGAPVLPTRVAVSANAQFRRVDYDYDVRGSVLTVTDPAGVVTCTERDALGRVKTEYASWTGTSVRDADTNRRTDYEYNGLDQQTRVKRYVAGTDGAWDTIRETTLDYEYGKLVNVLTPGDGPVHSRQDLYTYNTLGELVDQNSHLGPQHHWRHDELGRTVVESVAFDNSNAIDGAVLSRTFTYDILGRVLTATGYAGTYGGGAAKNQVQRQYDAWGHVVVEYQEPYGTRTANTRAVRYVYGDGAAAGLLQRLIYPATDAELAAGTARSVWYGYEGIDAAMGRPTWIADDAAGGSQILESYTYLGLSTVVSRSRPLQDSSTMLSQAYGANGIDGLGRAVDLDWTVTGQGSVQHLKYWYDVNGNLLAREDLVVSDASEVYHVNGAGPINAYDKLNQIKAFSRGSGAEYTPPDPLSTVGSGTSDQESWGTTAEGKQKRVGLENDVRARPTFQGSFDGSGMMSRLENWTSANSGYEPSESLAVRFDAWGNLAKLQQFSVNWAGINSATVQAERNFGYDAFNRRIGESDGSTPITLYVDLAGNVLEDRKWGANITQYVRSPVTGEVICRDRDSQAGGVTTLPPGIDERLYVLYDGQGNVSAAVSTTGQVQERYFYSPDGLLLITAADGSARAGSAVEQRYLYKGGRQDAAGIYRIGSGEWDYVTGGSLEQDANAYWNDQLAITPPSLGLWDRAVLKTVPILVGVTIGMATGGLGFALSGFFGGMAGGVAGGFTESFASGASWGDSLASGAVGGAIGGLGGFAGGAIMGRLATGPFLGVASSAQVSFGVQLGREALSGSIDGGAGGLAGGMIDGWQSGGMSGALLGGLKGAVFGAVVGGLTAGGMHVGALGFTHGVASAFSEGGFGGALAKIGQNFDRMAHLEYPVCFTAGTQVVTGLKVKDEDGSIRTISARELARKQEVEGGVITALKVVGYITANIEDLAEGDYVISRDQNDPDGPLVASRITTKYRRLSNHLQLVGIEDEAGNRQTIQTTDEHPFHAVLKHWTPSQLLELEDRLTGPARASSSVTSNRREPHPLGVWVYNMEVEGTHTYFVRAQGSAAQPVWVHNASYDRMSIQGQIAFEAKLRSAEIKLGDAAHFRSANETLAAAYEEIPGLMSKHTQQYGAEFVDAIVSGRTPADWTWHHALRAQANGEAGWLHLMPTDYHVSNYGVLHPDGFGGYTEWAIPAGAPSR